MEMRITTDNRRNGEDGDEAKSISAFDSILSFPRLTTEWNSSRWAHTRVNVVRIVEFENEKKKFKSHRRDVVCQPDSTQQPAIYINEHNEKSIRETQREQHIIGEYQKKLTS